MKVQCTLLHYLRQSETQNPHIKENLGGNILRASAPQQSKSVCGQVCVCVSVFVCECVSECVCI